MTDGQRHRAIQEQRRQEEARQTARRRRMFTLGSFALLLVTALVYFKFNFNLVALTPKKEAYPAATAEVAATWFNKTLGSISYGRQYSLEKLSGGQWQPLEAGPVAGSAEYTLAPFGKADYSFDLSPFGSLSPGQYRIAAQFEAGNPAKAMTAYCQFGLE